MTVGSMPVDRTDSVVFHDRFLTRAQAEHYRDRYRTGRRVKIDRMERTALRKLLSGVGRLQVALDIPSGTGRLTPVLAEVAERVILADANAIMLEVARDDLPNLPAEYLQADVEHIPLADDHVDLVFCHRFLHHIHQADTRARIFAELARVSRRYAVLTYYTPGFSDRGHWWFGRLSGRSTTANRPATLRRFYAEAAAAGLRVVDRVFLRRFPLVAVFLLFEKAATN